MKDGRARLLEQMAELVDGQAGLLDDVVEQARAEGAHAVQGHGRGAVTFAMVNDDMTSRSAAGP